VMPSLNIIALTATGLTSHNMRFLINLSAHTRQLHLDSCQSVWIILRFLLGLTFLQVMLWIDDHVMQPNCLLVTHAEQIY